MINVTATIDEGAFNQICDMAIEKFAPDIVNAYGENIRSAFEQEALVFSGEVQKKVRGAIAAVIGDMDIQTEKRSDREYGYSIGTAKHSDFPIEMWNIICSNAMTRVNYNGA